VPELRWILLGAGVALILGLWWWETRKARTTIDPTATWPRGRAEPSFDDEEQQASKEVPVRAPAFKPTIERLRAQRRPPLVEISDDMEVDVSAFVGRDRRRIPEHPPIDVPAIEEDHTSQDVDEMAAVEAIDDDHRAPWVSTHPLTRPEAAPKKQPAEFDEPKAMDPVERNVAEASKQRIVALRLVANDEHWDGGLLREAIQAEGLSYGKYSIFHREREDGKTLFYVASMMEPGSFDLAKMDSQVFPGISLFGIVPGPLEAPAAFDLLLATARHLGDRLKGQLQDEQGSTLTAQRILNLREELVHFEHRNRRLRRN
jgi:cell division protein ZipA